MQYRCPPRSRGPSGKTWPRWEPQRAQRTSVRTMPCERSSQAHAGPHWQVVRQATPDGAWPDSSRRKTHATAEYQIADYAVFLGDTFARRKRRVSVLKAGVDEDPRSRG